MTQTRRMAGRRDLLRRRAALALRRWPGPRLMTVRARTASTLIRLGCLVMALATPIAAAKPSVVTAGQAEIERGWQRYRATLVEARPDIEFPHQACFDRAATQHDLPVSLLLAVARGESNFEPEAVSKANAIGVMQILWPATANDLGLTRKAQLFDPCTNIDAGARYLKQMLARYDGNIHLALAAYNYGPGRIKQGASRVPDGAAWYSGYIFNHLQYVLRDASPVTTRTAPRRYADEKRRTLLTFWQPERAAAFVAYLRDELPSVRLDWFDGALGRFSVDLLYQDDVEHRQAAAALRTVGVRL